MFSYFASRRVDGRVCITDLNTGATMISKEGTTMSTKQGAYVTSMSAARGGSTHVVGVNADGMVSLWDVR